MAQITVSIRMDDNLKKQVEWFCGEFGMNLSTAVTMFAKAIVRERRIPFDISVTAQRPISVEELRKEELFNSLMAAKNSEGQPAEEAFADLERAFELEGI